MKYKTIGLAVIAASLILGALGSTSSVSAQTAALTSAQAVHILNRAAFGPRPGDVERLQAIGLRAYIEQQLHPEKIDDSRTTDRTRHLTSLTMSQSEIFEHYPNPQQLARQLGLRQPDGPPDGAPAPADNNADRTKIQQYMSENMLERPQTLLQQLLANRIVRGVYSEIGRAHV